MMKAKVLFWDVDTQYDFMMPDGRLYVPGARAILGRVGDVRRLALEGGYSILGDVDWHSPQDQEISQTPDFERTFPPHCMAGSHGAERVGWLGAGPIQYVGPEAATDRELQRLVEKEPFHVMIRKHTLDVFENPNTERLIELIRPSAVAVFGVALEFCVSYVLRGLARYGGIRLYVLRDAVKGLGSRSEDDIYGELEDIGVVVTDMGQLRGRLSCG